MISCRRWFRRMRIPKTCKNNIGKPNTFIILRKQATIQSISTNVFFV